jgi:pyruvate kinase
VSYQRRPLITGVLATACGGEVWSPSSTAEIIRLGVSDFRITPAFRSDERNIELLRLLRTCGDSVGRHVRVYYDVSRGSKLRTSHDAAIDLETETMITMGTDTACDIRLERSLERVLPLGTMLHIGDSEVILEVEQRVGDIYRCHVVSGGIARTRKAITAQGIDLGLGALNVENARDIKFAVAHNVDYLLLSFIKNADEVRLCREMVDSQIRIAVKIETREAIDNLESIVADSDSVMVARGDLAIQCGFESLALLEWRIAEVAREMEKPFIVATQVLESIMNRAVPARSDIVDLSSAVALGADAIMLGPETCMNPNGRHAVKVAMQIIHAVSEAGVTLRTDAN